MQTLGEPPVQVIVAIISAMALIAVAIINVWGIRVAAQAAKASQATAKVIETKVDISSSDTKRKLGEIHTLVNGRLHAAMRKITLLEDKLNNTSKDQPQPPPDKEDL